MLPISVAAVRLRRTGKNFSARSAERCHGGTVAEHDGLVHQGECAGAQAGADDKELWVDEDRVEGAGGGRGVSRRPGQEGGSGATQSSRTRVR